MFAVCVCPGIALSNGSSNVLRAIADPFALLRVLFLSSVLKTVQDDGRGDRNCQVRLHGPAGPGAGHQEERATVAAGRLEVLVARPQRYQQNRLRPIQLRGAEKQRQERLHRQEPQRHFR